MRDGAIVAIQGDTLHILAIFESKSLQIYTRLATLQEEGVGQIGWDFERFRQNRIRINGRIFEPSQVKISRNITDWYGVAPPDLRLKPEDIEKIQSGFQGFSDISWIGE